MQKNATDDITNALLLHGASVDGIRLFDEDDAGLLPYTTLVSARANLGDDLAALSGVYEWQHTPLLYVVDGEAIKDDGHLLRIRRDLAMHGEAPYVGVVATGRLTVYSVALDNSPLNNAKISTSSAVESRLTLPYLSNNRPGFTSNRRWIAQVVLKVLDDTISSLIKECEVSGPDAVSLVGRALFTRFLADRELLTTELSLKIASVSPEKLFDSSRNIKRICEWLDTTFNGDLLPISSKVISKLSSKAFLHLGNVMERAPGGQRQLDWKERWSYLDFAHIPVGVLSQAYEHYLRVHSPVSQRKDGGFYTPRVIAQMMTRGAMHALRISKSSHSARVLDPAAGAGVFLIDAFRQLVAERWRHDGKRPSTKILRSILYKQIAGFDINEEALRFAALGLYLMSIELDPKQTPVEKLRFPFDLRNRVLFKVGEQGEPGSLGHGVGPEHDGKYQLVIGNPPWSSSTHIEAWPEVKAIVEDIASKRLPPQGPRPLLPNEGMDLPFVWRAMRWCAPGGQIALALHARMLFQQGDGMPEARGAIFTALDITGIVNCAELRSSRVWPEVDAPYFLLFAKNDRSSPASGFRFVTPHREDRLNSAGLFRLDASNAPIVTPQEVISEPELLKIHFRGSAIDLEMYRRMSKKPATTLDEYWKKEARADSESMRSGNGYQRLRPSSRPQKSGDGLPGADATYLADLPELGILTPLPLLINADQLPQFNQERIHGKRPRALFRGPLLLVHQSPPANAGRITVSVCDTDVVFTESYYGYSAYGHPNGQLLVRFLSLVIGSKLSLWHALMTSGKFGFEREVVEKLIVDAIPIPIFDDLSETQLQRVQELFDLVTKSNTPSSWEVADAWVAELIGLKKDDLVVISETLKFNTPFSESKIAAQTRATKAQQAEFCEELNALIFPVANRFGLSISASPLSSPFGIPWLMLHLGQNGVNTFEEPDIHQFLDFADQVSATEVVRPNRDGSELWIARLDHARYWTRTQARLLARRVLWEHMQKMLEARVA